MTLEQVVSRSPRFTPQTRLEQITLPPKVYIGEMHDELPVVDQTIVEDLPGGGRVLSVELCEAVPAYCHICIKLRCSQNPHK